MQIVFDSSEVEKLHEILERELADLRVKIRRNERAADDKRKLVEEEILLTIMHKKFAIAALFAPRAMEKFEPAAFIE